MSIFGGVPKTATIAHLRLTRNDAGDEDKRGAHLPQHPPQRSMLLHGVHIGIEGLPYDNFRESMYMQYKATFFQEQLGANRDPR